MFMRCGRAWTAFRDALVVAEPLEQTGAVLSISPQTLPAQMGYFKIQFICSFNIAAIRSSPVPSPAKPTHRLGRVLTAWSSKG